MAASVFSTKLALNFGCGCCCGPWRMGQVFTDELPQPKYFYQDGLHQNQEDASFSPYHGTQYRTFFAWSGRTVGITQEGCDAAGGMFKETRLLLPDHENGNEANTQSIKFAREQLEDGDLLEVEAEYDRAGFPLGFGNTRNYWMKSITAKNELADGAEQSLKLTRGRQTRPGFPSWSVDADGFTAGRLCSCPIWIDHSAYSIRAIKDYKDVTFTVEVNGCHDDQKPPDPDGNPADAINGTYELKFTGVPGGLTPSVIDGHAIAAGYGQTRKSKDDDGHEFNVSAQLSLGGFNNRPSGTLIITAASPKRAVLFAVRRWDYDPSTKRWIDEPLDSGEGWKPEFPNQPGHGTLDELTENGP